MSLASVDQVLRLLQPMATALINPAGPLIDAAIPLREYGMSSLQQIALITRVEEEFSIRCDEEDLAVFNRGSIRDIASHLHAKAGDAVRVAGPAYWDEFAELDVSLRDFDTSVLEASDGARLRLYECGRPEGTKLVLITPLGTPFLLIAPLARALGANFHVIGWENRGGGYLDEDDSKQGVSVHRHARDLVEILESRSATQFRLLAWCTGANIASWMADAFGVLPEAAAFIAPSNIGTEATQTLFDTMFIPLVRGLMRDEDRAADYKLQLIRTMMAGRSGAAGEQIISRALALNFRDLRAARRYSRLLTEFSLAGGEDQRFPELFDQLCKRVPALLFHCLDDEIVSVQSSLNAVSRLPHARALVYPRGGHYVPFLYHEQIARDVLALLS